MGIFGGTVPVRGSSCCFSSSGSATFVGVTCGVAPPPPPPRVDLLGEGLSGWDIFIFFGVPISATGSGSGVGGSTGGSGTICLTTFGFLPRRPGGGFWTTVSGSTAAAATGATTTGTGSSFGGTFFTCTSFTCTSSCTLCSDCSSSSHAVCSCSLRSSSSSCWRRLARVVRRGSPAASDALETTGDGVLTAAVRLFRGLVVVGGVLIGATDLGVVFPFAALIAGGGGVRGTIVVIVFVVVFVFSLSPLASDGLAKV